MTQEQRLNYLLEALLAERGQDGEAVPAQVGEKRRLLRALFNLRPPLEADATFLRVQDAYLTEEIRRRGLTEAEDLPPLTDGLFLWRGDITTLRADAVVNAANSRLLGCFVPGHSCIDNAIHTYAGVQLRLACARLMERQGYDEPVGRAKITPAFNLPSRFVLHTVGPAVSGCPTRRDAQQLAACYRACFRLAAENGVRSLVFCCLSTGEFHFPNAAAAAIAVETVKRCRQEFAGKIQVVFNVFKEEDERIYRRLLGADR